MHISFRGWVTQAIGSLVPISLIYQFLIRFSHTTLLLYLLTLVGCQSMSEYDRQSVLLALADTTTQGSETWNVRIDIMEEQRRMIHVQSPYAITTESRDGNTTELHGPVYIEVRDSTGVPETTVQADKARYYSRAGEFHLEGNVRIHTSGDRRLYAQTLLWFQNTRTIETPDFVRIYTPTDSIAGYGLTGDDRLDTYHIRRVSGSFLLETARQEPNTDD